MSGKHRALPAAPRSGRPGRSLATDRTLGRLAERRVAARRIAAGCAALAVVGGVLSFTAGAGQAAGLAEGPTPARAGEDLFVGYNVSGSASPLKVEIYEPTIPLPASPQVELSEGYSAVIADSSSSQGRSSYLWPGGPVGEGFKVIAEQLGLPAQLAEGGYPIQVNALFPSGPENAADEPFPGMIQRAVAGEGTARAENGYSTDAEVGGGDDEGDGEGDGDGGGGGLPGLPGLPGVPGLPGLPGLSLSDESQGGLLGGLDEVLGGKQTSRSAAAAPGARGAAAAAPVLPPELAALVDVGGFSSVARTANDTGEQAFVQTRSVAGDISILGGLVTIDGVTTVASASSDGKKGVGQGRATYGTLTALGQKFRFGPDGFEAVGQAVPIPGLPDQVPAALEQLGLTISVPEPTYEVDGDAATTTMPGLVVDFDLTVLRKQLKPLTDVLNELVFQIPDEAGQLKSLIGAAANLSPRMVFTLGGSTAEVDTSQAVAPPPPPPTDEPTEEPTEEATEDGAAGTGGTDTGGAPPASTDPGTTPPGTSAPPTDTAPATTEATAPVSSAEVPGLPGVFSFPGLLLYGGLAGATVAGLYTRKLGALALGGAGSCQHGLDSGLPDLRKVT